MGVPEPTRPPQSQSPRLRHRVAVGRVPPAEHKAQQSHGRDRDVTSRGPDAAVTQLAMQAVSNL